MQRVRHVFFAAVLLGGAMTASAQETRPAATEPASDVPDPRQTLQMLNEAMRQGDVSQIKQLFLAGSPAEVKMIDADARMAAALADLRRAAVRAFGEEGARLVTGDTAAGISQSSARIGLAQVSTTGDTATVTYQDEKESPFVLKKVDGRWKIPVSQLGKPLDPASLDQRLSDLKAQRQVVEAMTSEIREGRFAGAEQAREAWRSRILQAATSQPSGSEAGR